MIFVLLSFLAGVITIFAPCVLPLLPVIIGGSMTGDVKDKKRPFIIAASLAISLILFTVLVKATTLFIDVPPETFTIISGTILIILGVALFFPDLYDRVITKLNLQAKSQQLLGKGSGKGATINAIIVGAALGPVFSSCSPVYAYILATVLPVDFAIAMVYMIAYVLGLSMMLLLVGFLGQRFLKRVKFFSNPRGAFMRGMAILFVIVGLLIITGFDKKLQVYAAEYTPFDFDALSSQLIPNSRQTNGEVFNVEPYDAPEFVGLNNWINSKPLTKEDLKGKVVLLDFWTYSCINCIRTQPYLKAWDDTYRDSGLVILGVHAPEFAFEKVPKNVEKASKEAGLRYPIALDNNFQTWGAYENQFWPASYLIDKDGQVRRYHAGEGGYSETEQAIRSLLSEDGETLPGGTSAFEGEDDVPIANRQTPETYLGTQRANNFIGEPSLSSGTHSFTGAKLDNVNNWTLDGEWQVSGEGITAVRDARLRFRVAAKEVYFVTGNDGNGKKVKVTLNNREISSTNSAGDDVKDSMVTIQGSKLYRPVKFTSFEDDNTLELIVPKGVQLNAFTFGG